MTGHDWLAMAVLVFGGLGVWAGDVAVNPRAPCRSCQGSGKHGLSRRKAFGDCRKCGNSGKRLRFGTRWVRPDLREKK